MGRCKYDQFKGEFSTEVIEAIIEELKNHRGVCEDNYDWNFLDIRVKRADKLQRHRFADTIQKLNEYIGITLINTISFSDNDEHHYYSVPYLRREYGKDTIEKWLRDGRTPQTLPCSNNLYNKNIEGVHLITVREFSQITGRNRKTVEDWLRKDLIIGFYDRTRNARCIDVERTIEKIKKVKRISTNNISLNGQGFTICNKQE